MSSVEILLVFIVAMLVAGFLIIFLLGYLLGLYDKYRARKRGEQPSDAPQPSP